MATNLHAVLNRLEAATSSLESCFAHHLQDVDACETKNAELVQFASECIERLEVVEKTLERTLKAKSITNPSSRPQSVSHDADSKSPNVYATFRQRCEGCLLGSAIGDALGAQCEFQPRGSFERITEMEGGGRYNLAPGMWTDDMSMALCLGESLLDEKKHNPVDQCIKYLKWYREAHLSSNGLCFDIGMTTSRALAKFEKFGDPYSGPTGPRAAGNGCLMRLSPIPVFFHRDPMLAIHVAGDQARTTHGALEAIHCCRYYCALILGALQGRRKEQILSKLFIPSGCDAEVWKELPKKVRDLAEGTYKSKEVGKIQNSGYVVLAMEAALWGFYKTDTFEDGLASLVNLGDDSDTIGAIYGMLAGAYYGATCLPKKWLGKVTFRSLIREMAIGL
eukprot:CAMPEP_0184505992 /NCGR_PEP_ID=MMETSP0113_2-20130426/53270_1 /TAXON_ID=91329 /ORGANISM="Norrisiella sphaerica, Strain BC52" /LENGTH=392 /DNA_ID=CAMNT_0026895695 /DNA_START=77 /DNA_END=1255 /DNA_ORIENTATION=-